ncbi:MAG: biotin/lipoyl-binding protein, partial [Alphaproteobacteria bacterium]|nr:biotin/lipoyl-binding protein [Alphaproteobacteria bacterium]
YEGAEIAMYYDPMIAKLCTYGGDRETAIDRMLDALDGFYISGVRHNIAFLAAIIDSARFRRGAMSTNLIAEMFPDGFVPPAEMVEADQINIIAAALADARLQDRENPAMAGAVRSRIVMLDGQPRSVTSRPERGGYLVEGGGESCFASTDWRPGQHLMHLRIDDRVAIAQIERQRGRVFIVTHGGVVRRAQVLSPRAAELLEKMPVKQAADTSRLVLSPMPGLLTSVLVSEGQEVKAGEPLVVVEAMKMENVLRAERDATVAKLRAKAGDSLAVDQIIIELE